MENQGFDIFFNEIKKYLNKTDDEFIQFAKGIQNVLDEKNSTWYFQIELENTTTSDKDIALFAGLAETERYATIDASHQYAALGGGMVTTPYPAGTIIKLKDDPRLLNKISGITVDAVATQEHHNSGTEPAQIEQTIYKDSTGHVTISSKDFYFDFLKDFVKVSPIRIFEFQFSTDYPTEVFSSKIMYKNLNPLSKEQIQFLNLEDYFLPTNNITTKIIVPSPAYVGEETFMSVTVPAQTKFSMSMRISAYHSGLKAIRNKLRHEAFLQAIQNAPILERNLQQSVAETNNTATD